MDQCIDTAVALLWQESNSAISELTKTIQGQLQQSRKSMTDLSEQVKEGVRLQVVSIGHTAEAGASRDVQVEVMITDQLVRG